MMQSSNNVDASHFRESEKGMQILVYMDFNRLLTKLLQNLTLLAV